MKRTVKEKVKVRNHTLTIFLDSDFGFIIQSDKNEEITESFTVSQKDTSKCVQLFGEIGSFKQVPFSYPKRMELSMEGGAHERMPKSDRIRYGQTWIVTYWDDKFVGLKQLYGELFDLFPMPLFGLKIDLSEVGSNYRSIITWFNSLLHVVEIIEVEGEDCDFRRYLYAMKYLKPWDRLTINAKPSDYWETDPIKFWTDQLYIKHASWLYLKHIKEMESSEIRIWYSNFTDEEINELFCSLKDGYNPYLKTLSFSIRRSANPETFLKDLNATQFCEDAWSFVLAGRRRCEVTYRKRHSEPDLRMFSLTIEKLPRLPLLKLPSLALVNVLESMKFVNLFLFANLSKRMKKIVKENIKIRNHTITPIFKIEFVFVIQSTKNKKRKEYICIYPSEMRAPNCWNYFENIGSMSRIPFGVPHIPDAPSIWTFWNDQIIGMKEMYNEISTVFPMPLTGIRMDLNVFGGIGFLSIVSWINGFNPRIPLIEVEGENCHFQLLYETIEQVFTEQLIIYATPGAYFEPGPLVTNVDQIQITRSRWVQVKHIKSWNSSRIEIEYSNITDKQINEFLRLLKAGSNPNLRKLRFKFMRHLSRETILEGLEATEAEREWRFQLENEEWCAVSYLRLHRIHLGLRELRIDIERKEEDS
ncbi:hypothetical protein CAEBREN_19154 [Caenorhabditis brenneri]|uniref:F-box domain-containing protein n=1 Tax=Caenorhabditis brenneri TaxID=135651 RepID=G0N2A1_CAEBE|nr:hypothetical protein CAEBREN_19154 [Caenorhabditis brenneri]